MRKTIVWLLVLTLLISMTACGGEENNLVGEWYVDGYNVVGFTFYSDGTCKIRGEYGTCTWDIVDGKLSITTANSKIYTAEYELSGDKLIINGNAFTRK